MQHMTPILQNPVIPHFAGEREDSRGELSSYCKFAADMVTLQMMQFTAVVREDVFSLCFFHLPDFLFQSKVYRTADKGLQTC